MNRTDLTSLSPAEVRARIREGLFQGPTAGLCPGYAQANLVVLPEDLAGDFLLFTQRNPRSCPVLEVSAAGTDVAAGAATGAALCPFCAASVYSTDWVMLPALPSTFS